MAVPFVLGTLFAIGIVGDRSGRTALLFCLYVGTAMSITAFPVLARILTDRELVLPFVAILLGVVRRC